MNSPEDIPLKTCPDAVTLSCYCDRQDDPGVTAHLRICPQCRKTVEDYQLVNTLLARAADVPTELSVTIIDACRTLPAPRRIFLFSRYFWQGAAALLAVSSLLAVYFLHGTATGQKSALVAATTVESPASMPVASAMAENSGFSYHDQLKLNGKIDPSRFMTVSTQNSQYATQLSSRRYYVGDAVSHIWLTDNMSQSVSAIDELAGRLSSSISWQERPQGGRVATLQANDHDLQSLVNELQRRRLVLVSPMYPQPFSEGNTVLSGKTVNYVLTLLAKE